MLRDEKITCNFATFNGIQLVCYSETALPWHLPTDDQDTGETANIAALSFQDPREARTAVGAPLVCGLQCRDASRRRRGPQR